MGNRWVMVALAGLLAAVSGCETEELKQRNTSLEAEKAQLQQQRDALSDELTAAKAELANARGASGGQLDEMSKALAQRDAEILRLQGELESKPAAEAMPTGWTERDGMAMITVANDVLFDSGKATLKGGAKQELGKIAKDIQGRFAGRKVLVVGHTDAEQITKSKWPSNDELSYARAKEVANALASLAGLSRKEVWPVGAGQHLPRVPNGSNGREARNRRVEILVY